MMTTEQSSSAAKPPTDNHLFDSVFAQALQIVCSNSETVLQDAELLALYRRDKKFVSKFILGGCIAPNQIDWYDGYHRCIDRVDRLKNTLRDVLEQQPNFEKLHQNPDVPEPQQIVDNPNFACPRCRSRKVTTEEKFFRSGDESALIFAHCIACDMRWKAAS
jgi:DNA-directed RNA polymerase subunit M/transcription elongation factor TFIIS